MSEPTTYHGSCHCGAVRYEAKAKLDGAITCNCSICSRTGMVLAFVPASQFRLLSGEEALQDYQFGKKHIHHPFCRECGIHAFGHGSSGDGAPMRAVNVRCLEGVELSSLTIGTFDGKGL